MNENSRKITILSDNIFFRLGLFEILSDICTPNTEFTFEPEPNHKHGIIFSESVASVYGQIKYAAKEKDDTNSFSINIPFFCGSLSFSQIQMKLEKILLIAHVDLSSSRREDIYQLLGVKTYQQISQMEDKVIRLVGKGNSLEEVAVELNSSEKTVKTHCRNAMRKMELITKVDFYRFARETARNADKERLTLCL